MIRFLLKLQSLIGAIIGAGVPIAFWFFTEWRNERKKTKENLYYIEKTLVAHINTVVEAYRTINNFLETKIPEIEKRTIVYSELDKYSVATAFFPLFSAGPIEPSILNLKTGSGYLDTKLAEVLTMSRDFPLMMDDTRRQFQHTIEKNEAYTLKKLNPPKIQNEQFLTNLREFKKTEQKEMLEINIPIYVRKLAKALATVREIRGEGLFRWHLKFSSRYKYFRNKRELKEYENGTLTRIDNYLKDRVDILIAEIESHYH